VPHSAVALVRTGSGWRGEEIDLDDVDDLEGLTEIMSDLAAGDPDALVVCFVEEDDEWLGVVRLVPDDDPLVFLSDARMAEDSDLAARLFADALPVVAEEADDEEGERRRTPSDPAGDLDIVADLGVSADALVELIAEEGLLPSDIVTAICERAGAADVLDELRGA
jgi:putative tRNA adenosine deaminase-associated protein